MVRCSAPALQPLWRDPRRDDQQWHSSTGAARVLRVGDQHRQPAIFGIDRQVFDGGTLTNAGTITWTGTGPISCRRRRLRHDHQPGRRASPSRPTRRSPIQRRLDHLQQRRAVHQVVHDRHHQRRLCLQQYRQRDGDDRHAQPARAAAPAAACSASPAARSASTPGPTLSTPGPASPAPGPSRSTAARWPWPPGPPRRCRTCR